MRPMKLTELLTRPQLVMMSVLNEPLLPTDISFTPFQNELESLTVTRLLAASAASPMIPAALVNLPARLSSKLLNDPVLPMIEELALIHLELRPPTVAKFELEA